MLATKKSMIALAALIGAGLVAAADMAQSRPQTAPAAAVAARFPSSTETMIVHNIGRAAAPDTRKSEPAKAEKAAPAACVHEHWPYIADECLVSDEAPRRPIRTIKVDRHVASAKTSVTTR